MTTLRPILVLIAMLSFSTFLNAQKNHSALFIGNSYTYFNNMPNMVSQIASSKGDQFTYTTHTPGGSTFSDHSRNSTARQKINGNSYDHLILQGQSGELAGAFYGEARHFHNSFGYAEYLDHLKELKDSCITTMFFMTWGYDDNDPQEYYDMQKNISDNYVDLANVLEASVAPVGEAWRAIYQASSSPDLHTSDQSHPTLKGSYLAACVFYTSIFHKSPVGAWGPASISMAERSSLQQQAYDTVMGQLSRWGIDTTTSNCTAGPIPHHNSQWENLNTNSNEYFQEIQFTSNDVGYAKSRFAIYRTPDQGDNWSPLNLPFPQYTLFKCHFVSDSIGFVMSGKVNIDSSSIDTIVDPFGLRYAADHHFFTRVYYTLDAGINWSRMPLDSLWAGGRYNKLLQSGVPSIHWMDFYFDDIQKGSLLFRNPYYHDTIYSIRTTDGGSNWTRTVSYLPGRRSDPFFLSADTIVVSADTYKDSVLNAYRTTDGGASWSTGTPFISNCCQTPAYQWLSPMASVGGNNILSTQNFLAPQILHSIDQGQNWQSHGNIPFVGRVFDMVELEPGQLMSIVENPAYHRICYSNDGGVNWKLDSFHPETLTGLALTDNYIYAAGYNGIVIRRKRSTIGQTEEEITEVRKLEVYPNPASHVITFDAPSLDPDQSIALSILEIGGREVGRFDLDHSPIDYNCSHLNPGVYIYVARDDKGLLIQRGRIVVL